MCLPGNVTGYEKVKMWVFERDKDWIGLGIHWIDMFSFLSFVLLSQLRFLLFFALNRHLEGQF